MIGRRILVVDDDMATVELTRFILGAAGFVVESTTDATHVLLQVAAFCPDLILMDIQMPQIDGLELTRRIKADASLSHIRVVAFTAFAMKGDKARMRLAGCDGYIAKPFDVATLAERVRRSLDGESISETPDISGRTSAFASDPDKP